MRKVNEKRKTEKICTFFYNRLFYKPFKMIIIFFISQAQFLLFEIRMTQEILKGEIGGGK